MTYNYIKFLSNGQVFYLRRNFKRLNSYQFRSLCNAFVDIFANWPIGKVCSRHRVVKPYLSIKKKKCQSVLAC